MLLNTDQAAEILGCHRTTVAELRDAGKLKDYSVQKEGSTKRFSKYDSKEVRELAKTYKAPRRRKTADAPAISTPGLFGQRLDRIEQKQDEILALLSDLVKAFS